MDESPKQRLLDAGFRYAMSLLGERQVAEDLVGDVWLAVAKRGGPWDRRYLFRSIRNRWVDVRRRQQVVSMVAIEHPEDLCGPEQPGVALSSLGRALSTLPAETRELLYLHIVEEWTTAELAEHCGLPRGTVLSRIHRARAELREQLTPRVAVKHNVGGAR